MRESIALLAFAAALACGDNTVHGKVVDPVGAPLVGARVQIASLAAVETDAQGNFAVEGAPDTYDAAVVLESARLSAVYVGLTRRDPTLYLLAYVPAGPENPTANLGTLLKLTYSGEMSGSSDSAPVLFDVIDPLGVHSAGVAVSGLESQFVWHGSAPAKARVAALVWDPAAEPSLVASGHADVQLTGDPLTVDVPTVRTTPVAVSGTTNPPAGCTFLGGFRGAYVPGWPSLLQVAWAPYSGSFFVLGLGWTDEAPLVFVAEPTCNDENTVFAMQRTLGVRRLGATTREVSFDISPPPARIAPADGATIDASTTFEWSASPRTISVLTRIDFSTGAQMDVVTAARSISFPDLTSLGANASMGSNAFVSVATWGVLDSVDSAAQPSGFGRMLPALGDVNYGWAALVVPPSMTFTGDPKTLLSAGARTAAWPPNRRTSLWGPQNLH